MGNKIGVLNDRFAKLMIENQKNDNDVAEFCGCSKRYINEMYNGKRAITNEYIILFAKYFNVSADYLLGLTDIKTPDKDKQFVCEYTGLNEKTIEYLNGARTDTFDDVALGYINKLVSKLKENENITVEMTGFVEDMVVYVEWAETIVDLYVNKENAKICDNFTAKNPRYYSITDPIEREAKIELLFEKLEDLSMLMNGQKYVLSNFGIDVLEEFSILNFEGIDYEYTKRLERMLARCKRKEDISVDEYNRIVKNGK